MTKVPNRSVRRLADRRRACSSAVIALSIFCAIASIPAGAGSERIDAIVEGRSAAWREASVLAAGDDANALLKGWTDVETLFAPSARLEISGHRRSRSERKPATDRSFVDVGEPEIIISTYYNNVAAGHVIATGLAHRPRLERLMRDAAPHPDIPDNHTIPIFPDGAQILMAAWWPAAPDRMTAFPVWDGVNEKAQPFGSNYLSWKRKVVIDPLRGANGPSRVSGQLLGRPFDDAVRVPISAVRRIQVSENMASELMREPAKRKAAVIALGRALRGGDQLLLAGFHIVSKRNGAWNWATFWWHDSADRGPFATGRPTGAPAFLHHYLMDIADDPARPTFNPWLEARFPDGGAGGGTASNCIACHQRASYPAISFLPVTTGAVDPARDAAFAPGRLRTDSIWGIPRRARR